jgi:hypothetical protein
MTKIAVSVKRDHIEALAATKRPIVSLAELIWNGLDADADKVSVRFDENALGGLERIRVADNGSGIAYAEAQLLFGSLGGSWKSQKGRTAKGRSLHGKSGKGRFRAFALGDMVEWNTTSKNNGSGLVDFSVKGDAASLDAFDLTEAKPAKAKTPGTEVVISNIHKNFTSLTDAKAPQEVANYFAVNLMEYPGITIDYNGTIVDPKSAHNRYDNLSLGDITLGDGKTAAADLTVIEWKAGARGLSRRRFCRQRPAQNQCRANLQIQRRDQLPHGMKIQFDAKQSYQLDAVNAVVDLFDGSDLKQPDCPLERGAGESAP